MRTVLRRVEPVSLGKIFGAIYAVIGIIAGLFLALFGGIIATATGGDGAGFGFLSIILFPIFYGIAGFLGGLITGFVYNLVADRVGGVEMEFDDWGEADIL